MYVDATVVLDVTKHSEPIHEFAHTGPRGADHIGECFLRNGRNHRFGLAGLPKFSHKQQSSRQTFFAVVKELIDKIFLSAYSAKQDELDEEIGELMLFVKKANHLFPIQLQRCAVGDRNRCRTPKSTHAGERLFSDEVSRTQKRYGSLFPSLRHNDLLSAPHLEEEDRIGVIPL